MAVCPNCHETNPEIGAACPRCNGFHYVPEASVEDAATDPMIGRMTAGKYVILGLISEGGMGAVYRALQLPVEREVAFKVLRTELKDSDNGRDRFNREARAVSRLNHANIITLYDFGFDSSKHPYMVMEYAPGKSLARWLKTESVTTERILRVTAQILSALTEAHSHGIVHRDLKPENMIITPKGNDPDRVKLLDFGIARITNEHATKGITREGEVFGTPHYMAPEQAQGRKDIGPPADVYAVGIMLWEMLAGQCPFDAPTPLAVLFMHINDPIPPLRPREGVELIPGLEAVVQKATAKDPMNRYQTAAEMMTDISHIFAHAGVTQNVLLGEISAEFGTSDTVLPGTIPPALDSQPGARAPHRVPHFTPAGVEIGSGVQIYDPDPSYIAEAPVRSHTTDGLDSVEEFEASPSSAKLGALAAFLFLAALGVAGISLVLQGNGDADADPAGPPTTETSPVGSDEIAAKQPNEITVEPLVVPTVEEQPVEDPVVDEPMVDEPVVDEPTEEVAAVAVEPKEPAKATTKPKPKPKPEAKPEPKEEAKPKPKETKPEPEAKEPDGPVKFAPVQAPWKRP